MGRVGDNGHNCVPYNVIRDISKNKERLVHFIGVGGVSMYSLARLTHLFGATISGSD